MIHHDPHTCGIPLKATQFAVWLENHRYERDAKALLGLYGIAKQPSNWSMKRLAALWRRYETKTRETKDVA